jgi:transposase
VRVGGKALTPPGPAGPPRPPRPLRRPALRRTTDPAHRSRPAHRPPSNGPTGAINGRLEHLRGSALGFRNLTNYIARALLETRGFRPRLHPALRRAAICQLRSGYTAENLASGKKTAQAVLKSFPKCPILEIARLGSTQRKWRRAFLACFETGRSSNGGAEAITGLIELHRRVARGFRNRRNYRLRMLLRRRISLSRHTHR